MCTDGRARDVVFLGGVEGLHLGVSDRLSKVVDIDLVDISLALLELEALDSRVLRERVAAAILARITDLDAWRRTTAASQAVRASWTAYADQWRPPAAAIRGLGAE